MRSSLLPVIAAAAIAPAAAAVTTPADKFYLSLPGTTLAQDHSLAGTAVRDTLVPFVLSDPAKTHGTIQVRTVRAATGQLSFYWKINVAADSKGGVLAMHVGNFPNHAYQADWRPDGLGSVAPAAIGGVVTTKTKQFDVWFQFTKPIAAGQSSRFFYVKTGATKTAKGFVTLVAEGGVSPQIASDAPLF